MLFSYKSCEGYFCLSKVYFFLNPTITGVKAYPRARIAPTIATVLAPYINSKYRPNRRSAPMSDAVISTLTAKEVAKAVIAVMPYSKHSVRSKVFLDVPAESIAVLPF
jgi:hypothetical protein